MRIYREPFSIPKGLVHEVMPAKRKLLLIYLMSVSDFAGMCRPGYEGMKLAMREYPGQNGCNSTVKRHLQALKDSGWIWSMRRTNGRMTIKIQLPPHMLAPEKEPKNVLSIVSR